MQLKNYARKVATETQTKKTQARQVFVKCSFKSLHYETQHGYGFN